jgi:outer membrane protein assembly factor BamB
MKLTGLLFFLIMVLILPAAGYAAGSDWPQFHNSANSAGYSTSAAPNTNNLLWASENIGASISSSPVIAGGKVYVYGCPSSDGFSASKSSIVCLDETTGDKIWETAIDKSKWGSWSSPAYDNGKIFIGSGSKAFCLDATSGTILWSYPMHLDVVNGSPRVVDGKAFFTDWDPNHGGISYIYCLDANGGSRIWEHQLVGDSQSTPAYCDGKIYVNSWGYVTGANTGANNTYCLDAGDGHEIWHQQGLEKQTCGSPSVGGGKVFVATYDFYGMGELAALDAGDGHIIWGPITIQRTDTTPAYADGKLYLCGGCAGYSDQETYCFDAETGNQIWKQSDLGNWTCSVAVADNKVFVGKAGEFFDYTGVYALDVADGHVVWSSDKGGASPVVADDKVFSLSGGKVYAFGSASASVSVTGVSLDKTADTIPVGGTDTLTATIAPANANNQGVTWDSDNEAVATVDADGKVTAVSAGMANITVTTTDGGFTAACLVTVTSGGGSGNDLNGDGIVNVVDLILIGQRFGDSDVPGWINLDVNRDGKVDILDMVLVAQNFTS